MIKALLSERISDKWGEGHFGASRGTRTHRGIDFCCSPDSMILSPVDGIVTKLGFPYSDDLTFQYVEISDMNAFKHRIFYVEPLVRITDLITAGDVIGASQKLGTRYKDISEHIHYEIKDSDGHYIDPNKFGELS